MTAPITVIVTGAGSFCGTNIIHSLRHAGGYRIIATDIYSKSAGLFLADRAYVVPKEGPDGRYVEAILDICRKEKAQVLIPGFDSELPYLSKARREIVEAGTVLVIGDEHFIRIANDKLETQRFLEANGFPYLRSYEPEQRDEAVAQLGFPMVVKPREAWGARGIEVVHSLECLELVIANIVERGWHPVLQEHIAEDEGEYTNSVMMSTDYDILGSITMRRHLDKGSSRYIFVEDRPDLRCQMEDIARAIRTRGPVNLQCRLRHGQAHILEFNARFSTTNVVRAVCGFNEVDILVKNFLYGTKTYIKDYTPAVVAMYQDYVYVAPSVYRSLERDGTCDHVGQVHNRLAR